MFTNAIKHYCINKTEDENKFPNFFTCLTKNFLIFSINSFLHSGLDQSSEVNKLSFLLHLKLEWKGKYTVRF